MELFAAFTIFISIISLLVFSIRYSKVILNMVFALVCTIVVSIPIVIGIAIGHYI
jgi:hypothetical protein